MSNPFAGPFPLQPLDIAQRIPAGTIGCFVLITVHEGDPYVRWVGRDDQDVARALLGFVGTYDQYAYRACEDDVTNFLAECGAFHDYGGLQELANALHPAPPLMDLFCPVCGHGEASAVH